MSPDCSWGCDTSQSQVLVSNKQGISQSKIVFLTVLTRCLFLPLSSPLASCNPWGLQTHETSFWTPPSSTPVSGYLQILPAGNWPQESYLLTRAPSADERIPGNTSTGQLLVCHVGAGRGHFLPLDGIGWRAEPTLCRVFSDTAAQEHSPPPAPACKHLLETVRDSGGGGVPCQSHTIEQMQVSHLLSNVCADAEVKLRRSLKNSFEEQSWVNW